MRKTHKPGRPSPGIYLAFDYGQKNIGVASGNTLSGTTTPLTVLSAQQTIEKIDWSRVLGLIEQWKPCGCVVGMPSTTQALNRVLLKAINRFVDELHRRFQLPVYTVDERLSSHGARYWQTQGTTKHPARVDDLAAALILQTWLDEWS